MKQHKAQCFFCSPYNHQKHSEIESAILSNEFNQNSIWGFRVTSRRTTYLHAEYIEKKSYIEKTIDPFGGIVEINRTSYTKIDFQINMNPPHIIIFQPPRSYRKVLNQLAQFLDYSVIIESKNVDVFNWIDLLEKELSESLVTKVNISPIIYDNSTTGKLILTSSIDVRKKLNKILPQKSFNIKNAQIVFKKNMGLPDVEIFSNGKIVFKTSVDTEKFNIFYNTFYQLLDEPKT